MKRDMELVRKILFAMEDSEKTIFSISNPPKIENYSNELVAHHMRIMSQANLLHVYVESFSPPPYSYNPNQTRYSYSLNWQGHEFLDALRDDKQWNRVKTIMKKAGGFILEIAIDVAKETIKKSALGMIQ